MDDGGDQEHKPLPGRSFGWRETAAVLRAALAEGPMDRHGRRRIRFVLQGPRPEGSLAEIVLPPLVEALHPGLEAPALLRALETEAAEPGTEILVLVQAGAAALGLWIDDALIEHKALKRYVVRGRGRAQPLHLKTRGKSRYGSRLRLQNHRALLAEVNERLGRWAEEIGEPDRVWSGISVRTLPELRDAEPPFPFESRLLTPVPFDAHVPDHAELLRIRGLLTRGRVVRAGDGEATS